MTFSTNAPAGRAAPVRPEHACNPLARLGDLASITPGYPFQSIQKNPDGKFVLLQKKDVIAATGPIQTSPDQPMALEHALIDKPGAPTASHYLQMDDLILARHAGGYLVRLLVAPAVMTICTEPLWVIRIVSPAALLPSYLAWYLNTGAAQKMLGQYMGQGRVRECLPEGFNSVAVRLPPMSIQQDIAALVAAHEKTDAVVQAARAQVKRRLEETLLKMTTVSPAGAALLLAERHPVH